MIARYSFLASVLGLCALSIVSQADAQSRKPRRPTTRAATAAPTPTPLPVIVETIDIPEVKSPAKRNERPGNSAGSSTNAVVAELSGEPPFVYEYRHPNYLITHLLIRHDAAGKGTITFAKNDSPEEMTDPITLSPVTLGKINALLNALDYFNSTVSYQFEKDYSHLGETRFFARRDGKQREVKFNWTVNKDAYALTEEYRKVGLQYIWLFDITVARENQPLNAPALMDEMDSYLRRNEISDPMQLLPALNGLAEDERIPLIARNHASKLIQQIEKPKK